MATNKTKSGVLGALSNAELHGLFAVQAGKMKDAANQMMSMLEKEECADFYAACKKFENCSKQIEDSFVEKRKELFEATLEIMDLMSAICAEQENKLPLKES